MNEFAQKYLNLIQTEFRGLNLTRILDPNEFCEKQYLDSLEPFNKSKIIQSVLKNNPLIIDIGFGGGFPLLPLAKNYSEHSFLGIETREKKLKAVKKIAAILGINNIKFLHTRYENLIIDRDAILTFKAVGKVDEMLNPISFTNSNIYVGFYKGPNFFDVEKENLLRVINWEIVEQFEYFIPNTDGRLFIVFKNKTKNVPRGTNKNLVNLSKYL